MEPLSFGRKTKWCSHYGKQYGGSSKKLKIELPANPATLLLGIYPEELNSRSPRDVSTLLVTFIVAPFTTAKMGKQPECPLADG